MYDTRIAVLGGSLIKEGGIWRTTNFEEFDGSAGLGDRLRVYAAAGMYVRMDSRKTAVLALGGKGKLVNILDAPNVADTIVEELAALGIPRRDLSAETRSGTTEAQLEALISELQSHDGERTFLVSNQYHLPRIALMMNHFPRLKPLQILFSDGRLQLCSAEKILIETDAARWKDEIERAYRSESVMARLKSEWEGCVAICEKNYESR